MRRVLTRPADEDDTAALLAELERIKAERAEEAARKEAARNAAADIERAAELASGNPLLDLAGGGGGPIDFSRACLCAPRCARLHARCTRRDALRLSLAALRARLPDAARTPAVKRSWHEETVFKNQARSEPAAKKRFINDTIRSDFHKRFLNRYIK